MAILAAFEEEELSRLYTEFAVGGPVFETGIVGNGRATQQRTIVRYDAVRGFEIRFSGMRQSEKLALEEFFITKKGRAVGFRFFPPSDRNFREDVIGIGDGTTTDFYMKRNYRSRSRFVSRRIVKPVKDKVTVTMDGSKLWINTGGSGGYPPEGDYPVLDPGTVGYLEIDWNIGKVRFVTTPAPAAGSIIRCALGEYDVPVYFDVDAFQPTDYGFSANWDSINLIEILPSQITDLGMGVTPLSLAFSLPASNTKVTGTFDVSFTSTGVTKVYLYRDGVFYASSTTAPFSFTGVPVITDAPFRVLALGVDNVGNYVEAAIDLNSEQPPGADDGTEDGGLII